MTLAELPELTGFFSYAREDDIGSAGRLTKLRERIQEELRSQLGRRRANFRIWQDIAAIPEGALWDTEIRNAVAQSVFFVPIITPTAIKSEYCNTEFEYFLKREKELSRNDLVFPIVYIRVPELENETRWRGNSVLKIVGERQYLSWLELRHLDMDSRESRVAIERFCRSIHDALYRPNISLEETNRQDNEARETAGKQAEAPSQSKEPHLQEGDRAPPSVGGIGATDENSVEKEGQNATLAVQPSLDGEQFSSAGHETEKKQIDAAESKEVSISAVTALQQQIEVSRAAVWFLGILEIILLSIFYALHTWNAGGFIFGTVYTTFLLLGVLCTIIFLVCIRDLRKEKAQLRKLKE